MAVIKNSESNPLSKRHDRYIVDLKKDSEEKPKYSDMGILEQDILNGKSNPQKSHSDESMKYYMTRVNKSGVEPISGGIESDGSSLEKDLLVHYKSQPERNLNVNENENKYSILHYIQRSSAGTVTDIIIYIQRWSSGIVTVIMFIFLWLMSYGAYIFHGTRKKRRLVVTYLLLGLTAIGNAKQCKETDKITVRISGTLTIGKELKLQCRRAMSGTPRWEKERSLLTFNLRVENFYKHKIDLEPTKNKYDITIKNATWGDINATYTCHVGYDCKQISPVEFYTVLPSNEIKSIKESVYNNDVLNGSLVFQHVYPLPECVLFSNGIRLLVLRICNTCSIWKMFFFKVEFHFTVKLNNTNLSGCNNTVKCSIGDKEYTYIFPTENADQATNEKDKFGVGWIIFIVVVIIIVSGVTILILCWLHSYFKRDTNRTQDYETVHQPPIHSQ